MIDDIMYFAEPFSTLEHREFNFLTLIGFLSLPLGSRKIFEYFYKILQQIDNILLSDLPILSRLCLDHSVEVKK